MQTLHNVSREQGVLGWHFGLDSGRLAYADGRWIRTGALFDVPEGKLYLKGYGLHSSEKALDALRYAGGCTISRVLSHGRIVQGSDQLCASQREHLAVIRPEQGKALIREFIRWCALDVAPLWQMPPVVRQYLETGDRELALAARNAAFQRYEADHAAQLAKIPTHEALREVLDGRHILLAAFEAMSWAARAWYRATGSREEAQARQEERLAEMLRSAAANKAL